MKNITNIILILIFTAAGISAQEKANAADASREEALIRQVVQQLQDGWNAHDGKAFAAPFAVDADYVVVNGMHAKGRDEIEKGHVGIFTTVYKDSRNAATVKSIRFLRKDVAVVHVEWNLEFQMNGETKKAKAMSTMIMTKEKGKWEIAAFQNTPVREFQAQGEK
jgi:uncharacterized protein (TIGR02246 family)